MSKPNDFVVDNASGADVRTDLNNLFDAISINNGFGSVPTTKYKYMWYADTSSGKMSFYKANASDKLDFISLTDGSFFGPNGSASNPSYTFTNSTSTGFFRNATNEIGVSNNGVNTALFKTTGTEIKGKLEVIPTTGGATFDIKTNGLNDQDVEINFVADTTYTTAGLSLKRLQTNTGKSQINHRGTGNLEITTQDAAPIVFSTSNTNRFEIKSGGAFIPVGSSFANANTSGGAVCAKGFGTRNGADTDDQGTAGTGDDVTSASTGNLFNFYWDGNDAYFYIDNTRLGHIDSSTTSDYRIKREITTLTVNAIERIKKLRPVTFKYKDYGIYKQTDDTHEGFIAHEVGEVIPDACKGNKDERLQVIGIAPIVANLTKALQEAVAKIETLETKVAALEGA